MNAGSGEITRTQAQGSARRRFDYWLSQLNDTQLEVLLANWDNIMNDATLTRIESWVIAEKAIAEIHSLAEPPQETP
jgi:hypothetical protein